MAAHSGDSWFLEKAIFTCGTCRYELSSIKQQVCPECGTQYTKEAAAGRWMVSAGFVHMVQSAVDSRGYRFQSIPQALADGRVRWNNWNFRRLPAVALSIVCMIGAIGFSRWLWLQQNDHWPLAAASILLFAFPILFTIASRATYTLSADGTHIDMVRTWCITKKPTHYPVSETLLLVIDAKHFAGLSGRSKCVIAFSDRVFVLCSVSRGHSMEPYIELLPDALRNRLVSSIEGIETNCSGLQTSDESGNNSADNICSEQAGSRWKTLLYSSRHIPSLRNPLFSYAPKNLSAGIQMAVPCADCSYTLHGFHRQRCPECGNFQTTETLWTSFLKRTHPGQYIRRSREFFWPYLLEKSTAFSADGESMWRVSTRNPLDPIVLGSIGLLLMLIALLKGAFSRTPVLSNDAFVVFFLPGLACIRVAPSLFTQVRNCVLDTERKTVVVEDRLLGIGVKRLAPLDKVDIYCFKKPTTHFFAMRRYACTLFTESAAVVLCVTKTPEQVIEYAETLPLVLREKVVSLIDEGEMGKD